MDKQFPTTAIDEGEFHLEEDPRLASIISAVGILGIVVHVVLAPSFFLLGLRGLALLNCGSVLIWSLGWLRNRKGDHPGAIVLMSCEVMVHTVIATAVLGFQAGFQYYLIGAIPFTIFNTRWRSRHIVATASAMIILFVTLYLATPYAGYDFDNPGIVAAFHLGNAVIAFVAITIASYYFRTATLVAEQELTARATTDALTGIPNRRRMVELLELESARTTRTGQRYALVIVDVDHFKAFNDDHGHECGDAALRRVARTLESRLRATDHLARWGGEEFLIILPGTGARGAKSLAESLREAIESTKLPYRGQDIRVTATFGIAVGREDESIDAVLRRADLALYEGKRSGRNRVVLETLDRETARAG